MLENRRFVDVTVFSLVLSSSAGASTCKGDRSDTVDASRSGHTRLTQYPITDAAVLLLPVISSQGHSRREPEGRVLYVVELLLAGNEPFCSHLSE
jgi:hypothetical protein